MDTMYSTLQLAPQELVSYILDFDNKQMYLKQKNSCKYFNITTSFMKEDGGKDVAFDLDNEKLPNIAELFDLFPYVMYYTGEKDVNKTHKHHEFKYSYPLGKEQEVYNDAELLMYFKDELD